MKHSGTFCLFGLLICLSLSCVSTEESSVVGGAPTTDPPDTQTGVLLVDGEEIPVTVEASWSVSSECGSQLGILRVTLYNLNTSFRGAGIALPFDGEHMPERVEFGQPGYPCPQGGEPYTWPVELLSGGDPPNRFYAESGTLTLSTTLTSDTTFSISATLTDVVLFNRDTGETMTLSGTFSEEGALIERYGVGPEL